MSNKNMYIAAAAIFGLGLAGVALNRTMLTSALAAVKDSDKDVSKLTEEVAADRKAASEVAK